MCMVMALVMIPSFFASAAELPAQQEAAVVAADDAGTGQVDNTLKDLPEVLAKLYELLSGGLKVLVGSDVFQNFVPALKKVLSVVSIGEFFKTVAALWKDITG